MDAQMSTDDTMQCLREAACALSGDGPIKERLLKAWSQWLAELDPATLPDDLLAVHSSLQCSLQCARALPGETAVRASIRKMSGAEAAHHAALVIDLLVGYCSMSQSRQHPRRPSVRLADDAPAMVELLAAGG